MFFIVVIVGNSNANVVVVIKDLKERIRHIFHFSYILYNGRMVLLEIKKSFGPDRLQKENCETRHAF